MGRLEEVKQPLGQERVVLEHPVEACLACSPPLEEPPLFRPELREHEIRGPARLRHERLVAEGPPRLRER